MSFSRALLCKWVWRFLSGEESLWKRIILSRHGSPFWKKRGPRGMRWGGGGGSGWWWKILTAVEGENGRWFWEKMVRRLGDVKDMEFWHDVWTGGER